MTPEQLAALGLQPDATPEQVTVALNAVIAKNAEKAATPSLDTYVPRADYDAALNRATTLEADAAQVKVDAHKAEIEVAIAAALKGGKITPATVEYHREACGHEGGLKRFADFVGVAPEVVANDVANGGSPPVATGPTSSTAKMLMTQFNLTPEEWAKGAPDAPAAPAAA